MPITQAIVLAGGLGTRLRSAVPDLPKCMAPVKGKPFLAYIIDYYSRQGITDFIFSLGYKHELITGWLRQYESTLHIQTVIEDNPLGTGGGIRLAAGKAGTSPVLVLNGDTIFKVDVQQLDTFHAQHNATCSLSLKPMQQFARYGVVEIDAGNRVKSFHEKKYYDKGLINGGVYVLNPNDFLQQPLPAAFSFEKDYLEKNVGHLPIYGCVQEGYFIDIGIPEDYALAEKELN